MVEPAHVIQALHLERDLLHIGRFLGRVFGPRQGQLMVLSLRVGTEKDNPPLHVLVGDGEAQHFRVKAPHLHQIVTKQSHVAQAANLWHTGSLPPTCLDNTMFSTTVDGPTTGALSTVPQAWRTL